MDEGKFNIILRATSRTPEQN